MRTCAQPAHVCEDDGVGLPARHARPHGLRAEGRAEHVCVHRLLPDVYPLWPAVIPAQLILQGKIRSVNACKTFMEE